MKNAIDIKARSPWTPLSNVKSIILSPSDKKIDGIVTIPGSKSLTNRALIMSALADGRSKITGILKSDDSFWCVDSLQKLGVNISVQQDTAFIDGKGGKWDSGNLYIGAAGTIARFLPGVLAFSTKGEWKIEASHSMNKRPIASLVNALNELGCDIQYIDQEGYYPLTIKGKEIVNGNVNLSGKISSQFISGLLIAAPLAKKSITINIEDYIVQHSYVLLTLQLMEQFGANVEYDNDLTKMVVHSSQYTPQNIALEADASTACYFLALAALTNGKIRINNLTYETEQPDIKMVDILEQMGCTVTKGATFIEVEGTAQLKGAFEISMRAMSDQTLTLAALAPFADGPITIKDVEHIRYHESDRIKVICDSLTKLGIRVEEFNDGLKVYPGIPKPTLLHTYDDHRVAMSLALIGARIEGIELDDHGCVSKTCPNYFQLLESLGVNIQKESNL